MEKNEVSRIPEDPNDPKDAVVSLDDPKGPVVSTLEKKREKTVFESGSQWRQFPKVKFKHEPNDTKIVIEQLKGIFGAAALQNIDEQPVRQCCIYKVPRDLRNIDRKAYTPRLISIGPFHHGNTILSKMENQKLRYMLEFGGREGPEKVKEFKRFIEEKEQIIRNYYQENSSLKSPEFVKMILLDAVFIIEFFFKNMFPVELRGFDFFLDTACAKAAITRDLQLLENQLPYFLLQNLFVKGAFRNVTKKDYPHQDPFLILSLRFFFNYKKNDKKNDFPKPKKRIEHFTDLVRYFLLKDFLQQDQKQEDSPTETKLECVRDLRTATKLQGSGVKFTKGAEGGSSLKITCEYVPRAIPIQYFNACVLQIPCFEIDDWSECQYRNLMALELCLYPEDTHICNFILLMNFLIDDAKDVDLLVDRGIICSRLGDNATVATMFNKLGLQITPSPSVYHHEICKKLKAHYDKRWNRAMANLNTVYFGDIWMGTATVAAVILLGLTVIGAVCSILQVVSS
ncbi:hypothetical protein Ddye_018269 [Dipteronia dyeriana]|uniref:Uncharacterized protein n=1 Tax=Dipteronia dyeriana TaxID=168575 RepID=A0AAD9UAS1_9ROSI|nr:hypothetical protein Ddye_018269 [Dipteronia dyeriana]